MSASPGPEKEQAQPCIQDLRPPPPSTALHPGSEAPSAQHSPLEGPARRIGTQSSCNEGSLRSGLAAMSGRHPASSQGTLESCSAPRLTLIESVLTPAGPQIEDWRGNG